MSNDMPDVINNLINLVEGAPVHDWRNSKGMRLKDTNEWVAFYVAGKKYESHVQQLIKDAEERKVKEILKGLESEDDSQQLRAIIASIKAILNAWGECNCTFAQKMTGDGCKECNPQYWIDHLDDRIKELEKERRRLLVLATKHCPSDHHDWEEILKIAGGE